MIRTNVKRRKISRSTVKHQQKEVVLNNQNKPVSAKNLHIDNRLDFTKINLANKKRKLKKQKQIIKNKFNNNNIINTNKFKFFNNNNIINQKFKDQNFYNNIKKLSYLDKKIFYGFSKKQKKKYYFVIIDNKKFYKISYFNINYYVPFQIFSLKKKELKQYYFSLKKLKDFNLKLKNIIKKIKSTKLLQKIYYKIAKQKQKKIEILQDYQAFKKKTFFDHKNLLLRYKYILNFSKQKNNYFLALNTRFNKLIFLSSAGQGIRIKAEKVTIHAIDALFRRIALFLLKNKIYRLILLLKKIPLRFTKRILTGFKRLKRKKIDLLIAKKFLFSHSKGLRKKKKKDYKNIIIFIK